MRGQILMRRALTLALLVTTGSLRAAVMHTILIYKTVQPDATHFLIPPDPDDFLLPPLPNADGTAAFPVQYSTARWLSNGICNRERNNDEGDLPARQSDSGGQNVWHTGFLSEHKFSRSRGPGFHSGHGDGMLSDRWYNGDDRRAGGISFTNRRGLQWLCLRAQRRHQRINDQGMVEFPAQIQGGSASFGIFLYHDGTTRAIAWLGATAPGGGTFTNFDSGSAADALGRVVFAGTLSTGYSRIYFAVMESTTTTVLA